MKCTIANFNNAFTIYNKKSNVNACVCVCVIGLFNRAIAESGSAFCHWALAENAVEKTKELAESLGCPTYYTKDTVKCLRSRPATAIAESLKNFMVITFYLFFF